MTSMRIKFFIAFTSIALVVFGVTYGVMRFTFISSFQDVELKNFNATVNALTNLVAMRETRMKGHARDWSCWDETYDFVLHKDPTYKERNLTEETFRNLDVSWMIYLDASNHVVEEAYLEQRPIQEFLGFLVKSREIVFAHTQDLPKSGVYFPTSGDPVMFVASPIVTSTFGGPIAGTLVLARLLNDDFIRELNNIAGSSVSIRAVKGEENREELKKGRINVLDSAMAQVAVFKEIGSGGLVFEFPLRRDINLEALRTEKMFLCLSVFFIMAVMMVLWFLLGKKLLGDVDLLTREIRKMLNNMKGEINLIPNIFVSREIRSLVDVFNNLAEVNSCLLQQKLEREKEILKFFEIVPFCATLVRRDTKEILWANKKLLETLGFSEQEIMGKSCVRTFCSQEKGDCPFDMGVTAFDVKECIALTREGNSKDILKSALVTHYRNEECVLEVFVDISEKKSLEKKLIYAEKLKSVGLLAGSVAHELNNLLTSLVIYPELLLQKDNLPQEEKKYIKILMNASLRAGEIVGDLLAMSRHGFAAPVVLRIDEILKEVVESPEFQRLVTINKNVAFIMSDPVPSLRILGSKTNLMKTFLNLIKNGYEAIQGKGRLEVRVFKKALEDIYRGYEDIPKGEYVVVEVSDTGIGISQEDLKHIFEPFYTKKKMNRGGTGLGTTVVWNVVKECNGYIDVESEIGKGTVFRIFLPLLAGDEGASFSKSDDPSVEVNDKSLSSLRVLLVDDLQEQRNAGSFALRSLGVKVDTVSTGREAVNLAMVRDYDVIFMDVLLGNGEDGVDAALSILEKKPYQNIVLVTGYGETDRIKRALGAGVLGVIRKPYKLEELKKTLTMIAK